MPGTLLALGLRSASHSSKLCLSGREAWTEQRMVGGLSFLVGGHMTVCVSGQGGLLVRVGAAEHPTLVRADHVEPMVMGARASRTWVQVGAAALSDGRGLEAWVARGVMTAAALPAK